MDVRKDFPILKRKINGKRLVYLDNAATSQKPKAVIDSIKEYYENYNANVHRGIHTLSEEASKAYDDAHKIVADFINAKEEEIIFTKGTTEGLNLLARTLGKSLKEGDEIILSEMEHHSNIVPWQELAKTKKLKIKFIPVTKEYRLDLEKAKELITKKTKIVSVVHMSNMLGVINPIKELAEIAHKVNAIFITDAAQSTPHKKIDVKELDCDFLVFSGHKMLGPTGVGVLYGKKKHLEELPPFLYGGDMVEEVTYETATWQDLPFKFEAGTPNIAQAIGLAAAIKYLEKIGIGKVENTEKELTKYALKELKKIKELKIIGPQDEKDRGAVFAFTLEGVHPHDLSEILNREGIAVRSGYHCVMPLHKKLNIFGTTRASLYIYNTKEDVDSLVKGIKKAMEVFA